MSTVSMTQLQQSTTRLALAEGRAMRLAAAPQARWLRVNDGQLWLTASAGSLQDTPDDCWLQPGDSVALPAGQEVVLEAWPSARFELLGGAPASTAVNASLALKPAAALRRWLQGARPQHAC